MKVFAMSQKGANKAVGDDRILIGSNLISEAAFSCRMTTGIIAVADGVGGNRAGYVASQYVLNRLAMETESVTSESELLDINRDLLAYSERNPSWKGMATTVSGLHFLDDAHEILFHVGNTRVYLIQGDKYLRQLTEDDTTVNYLVKTGKLTDEEAEIYENRNEIVACFGGDNERLMRPTVKGLNYGSECSYLLTSDGVHEFLSVDELEDIIVRNEDGFVICRTIIEEALRNGSEDDLSVIYVEGE